MIVNHQYRFIFLKTNKTAGTSLEIALSAFCSEYDIITPISPKDEEERVRLGFRGAQNYVDKKLNLSLKAHSKAQEIKDFVGDEVWNSYFKFCFERNPWDKVISHYYWRGGGIKYTSIGQYLKAGELLNIKAFNHYSIDGNVVVDQIYKYEMMHEALVDLSAKVQFPSVLCLPEYKAKSGFRKDKRPYQQILSDEEAKLIAKVFHREITLMNYVY